MLLIASKPKRGIDNHWKLLMDHGKGIKEQYNFVLICLVHVNLTMSFFASLPESTKSFGICKNAV